VSLEQVVQALLPYILGAVVGMQVWFLRQIMEIRSTLVKLEEHKSDNSELKKDVTRQGDQTAVHSARIQAMESKLDLILRKIESLEENCLLHRLLQRADPEQLLRILQSAKDEHA